MNQNPFSKIKRKYFEVFGDLESEIIFLRRVVFVLTGILFALLVFLFLLGRRPPVVIRVSEVEGARAVTDMRQNNQPSESELIGFAKRFTTRYTAYNSYTISRDMAEAMNYMTLRLQKEAKKRILDSGLFEKLKAAGIDTEIEFKESKIEHDSENASAVSLVGLRRITKYSDPAFKDEMLFRSDLILKKVLRTVQNPEGLQIEQYREMTLNQLTERKNS